MLDDSANLPFQDHRTTPVPVRLRATEDDYSLCCAADYIVRLDGGTWDFDDPLTHSATTRELLSLRRLTAESAVILEGFDAPLSCGLYSCLLCALPVASVDASCIAYAGNECWSGVD